MEPIGVLFMLTDVAGLSIVPAAGIILAPNCCGECVDVGERAVEVLLAW